MRADHHDDRTGGRRHVARLADDTLTELLRDDPGPDVEPDRERAIGRALDHGLGALPLRSAVEPHAADDEIDAFAGRDNRPDERVPGYGGDIRAYLGNEEPSAEPAAIYYVDGLIVRGEPTIVLGEPKIGKTLTVEDLAVSMAAGLPDFCGRRIYDRTRVLLMPREDSKTTTCQRLWQITRARGVAHEDLSGWLEVDGTTPLRFDDPALVARFRACLARFDVAFIDSLSTIHAGDENAARDMAATMNAWRDLSLETNTSIVVVHHLRKPGESGGGGMTRGRMLQRARGSSLIGATARHAVFVSDGPDHDQIRIDVEGNHPHQPEPFVIARQSGSVNGARWIKHDLVGLARSAADDDITRKIVAALDNRDTPISRSQLAALVGGNKGHVLRVIDRAVGGALVAIAAKGNAAPVMLATTARRLGYKPPPSGDPRAPWGAP